jgi:hypothetical protein
MPKPSLKHDSPASIQSAKEKVTKNVGNVPIVDTRAFPLQLHDRKSPSEPVPRVNPDIDLPAKDA